MKSSLISKKRTPLLAIAVGVFTKRDAVAEMAAGKSHIHSTQLGTQDSLVKQTQTALSGESIPTYSWEEMENAKSIKVKSSESRSRAIKKAIAASGILSKRELRERAEGILEELISNAIYHAYRDPDGKEKYSRHASVELEKKEILTVFYRLAPGGLYLSVEDHGGNLHLDQILSSLSRCYGHASTQIDSKLSGAGLGLYLVFESVTHLKIITIPGKSTKISCWIADQSSYEPTVFSFNYFEVKEK